ncbi:MAG: HDOD domain-containing protein [Bryobacteraceae bacterium]
MLEKLTPFPEVARKLLALLDEPTVTIPEVANLVRSDAAFAAEVLRLSNSAVMGLRFEVVSILHGVTVLGMDRLRALVLTVAMRDFVTAARHTDLLRRSWRHNLATALIAEWIAGGCWIERSDAYAAGLLHDLGRLALVSLDPNVYGRLIERMKPGADIAASERAAYGFDHVEASRWLVDHWGIPAKLRPAICGSGEEMFGLGSLAAAACHAAGMMAFAFESAPEPEQPVDAGAIGAYFNEFLPEEAWAKLEPELHQIIEAVPFKINVFETEFLT